MSHSVWTTSMFCRLAVAADVVGLAGAPRVEHARDRRAVVLDVQPVAHVLAVAVDRQRLARERVDGSSAGSASRGTGTARSCSSSWWSAPAGRTCGDRRARRWSRRRLGGRVRAVGRVRRRLRERRVVGAERAVDLVGGHVQEAERVARVAVERASSSALTSSSRAKVPTTLVSTKAAGPVDRAVDVALGGEVDDRPRLMRRAAGCRPARGRRCRRARIHGGRSPSSAARFSGLPA